MVAKYQRKAVAPGLIRHRSQPYHGQHVAEEVISESICEKTS